MFSSVLELEHKKYINNFKTVHQNFLPIHALNCVMFQITFVGHLFNKYIVVLRTSDQNFLGIPFQITWTLSLPSQFGSTPSSSQSFMNSLETYSSPLSLLRTFINFPLCLSVSVLKFLNTSNTLYLYLFSYKINICHESQVINK